MFQTKVVERIKTHILCSVTFFSPENRAFYEIKRKNIVEPDRPQTTTRIWRTRFARRIHKSTNIQSEYIILNEFSQQQWFHERASILRYTYIARFLLFIKTSFVYKFFNYCFLVKTLC
jgi:hypothetical protein